MRMNAKTQKARDAIGKSDLRPEIPQVEIDRMMYVYGMLLTRGPLLTSGIAEITGWNKAMVSVATTELVTYGLATEEQLPQLGSPKRYTPVRDAKLPDGWTKQSCTSMTNPYVPEADPKNVARAERTEKAADNPLTKALAKADVSIPEGSLASYQRFVEDLARMHYGVKEIDDIVAACTELARERVRHVDRACPFCKGRLEQDGTAARCTSKRCGKMFDSKETFDVSVDMMRRLAEMMQ